MSISSGDQNDFDESDGSNSNDDDLSICKELEELERQLHETHIALHTSIETLENIHSLVVSGKNINVICGSSGGEKCDFDEVLEKLHAAAMAEIDASKGAEDGGFSDRLLKALDECEFC
jgi:hypothetical protein